MNAGFFLQRNLRETWSRFLSLLLAVCLGAVLLLAVSGGIGREVARLASALDNNSALTILEIQSFNSVGRPDMPLTAGAISTMRRIRGVEDVRPYRQFAFMLADDSGMDAGPLWATPAARWAQPPLIATMPGLSVERAPAGDEAYFPDRLSGVSSAPLLGKRVTIEYNRTIAPGKVGGAETAVRVIGLYDSSMAGSDGEAAVYVSDSFLTMLLAAQLGLPPGSSIPEEFDYGRVYVKASSTHELRSVQQALAALGFNAISMAALEEDLPAVLTLVARLNDMLGLLVLVFSAGVGFCLGRDWLAQRRWDVGVLSSLGWPRRRILAMYGGEILIVGAMAGVGSAVLGSLASLGLGFVLFGRQMLGVTFATGAALPETGWLVAVVFGLPLALFLGAAPRVVWLTGLPPDTALRGRYQ